MSYIQSISEQTALERKNTIISLKVQGYSYGAIAELLNITPQRVQQIIAPSPKIAQAVYEREHDRCQKCGALLGYSARNIHHAGDTVENFESIDKLELLCHSCHRLIHVSDHSKIIRQHSKHPSGRPKGSKSKSREGYAKRTAALKERFGSEVFREWGKKGGNPVLVKKDRKDSDVSMKETHG